MTMNTTEQDLRREAIRRRLQGERPRDICRDLNRSRSWFDKWWAEYRHNPQTDFADHSRAPRHSPHRPGTAVTCSLQPRTRVDRNDSAGLEIEHDSCFSSNTDLEWSSEVVDAFAC